jgi:hypothetical protein
MQQAEDRSEMHTKFYRRNLQARDHMEEEEEENNDVDLMEVGRKYMNWVPVAQKRTVMGSCEHGNEPSGFHKSRHNISSN